MSDDSKIGVYLCTCRCEIEKTVDLGALAREAAGWDSVATVRKHDVLCSEDGIAAIKKDITKLGLERVMIAACSPSFKKEEFSGLGINQFLVERVNLREQCSSAHRDDPRGATAKARMLLRLSLEKTKLAKELHPVSIPVEQSTLVIGGGVAGMNAAIETAGTGHEVFLVEKEPFLGGKAAGLHRYFPRMCPPSCGLELMYSTLAHAPLVRVLTSSAIDSLSGAPGNFEALVKTSPRHVNTAACLACGKCRDICPRHAVLYPEGSSYPDIPVIKRHLCADGCRTCVEICPAGAIDLDEQGSTINLKAGAIVLATGWDSFDPTPLTEYGYGRLKNVVTNWDFEGMVKKRPAFLGERRTAAFIQCVGSRNERYLPYCSGVCCMASIKQALSLKEAAPESEVYIFHNDIRTPGEYEELYQRARRAGVVFIKGTPSELRQNGSDTIAFSVFDTTAGERLDILADLVVLATGMKPSQGTVEIAEKAGIALNKNNFVDSHLQCRPQDTGRNGVFSAGCCRTPMDVSRSIESAGAAAIKTLRVFNSQGTMIPDHPAVNTLKCDVCKRCMEECPSKAYGFDEKGFPRADMLKCRRCGICMGGCPLAAVSLGELSIDQLSGMLDVFDKSYLGAEEPAILGFLCKNDAYKAADDAALSGLTYPPNFIGIMVPCAGAVNGAIIAKAISTGIDGILVAGCPEDQCHHAPGSALAKSRLNDVSRKLAEMYLEPERIRFVSINRDESGKLVDTVRDFTRLLKGMGRNPLTL